MKDFLGKRYRKTSMLSIRVSPEDHCFLREMHLSPTKLFDGALKKAKRRRV